MLNANSGFVAPQATLGHVQFCRCLFENPWIYCDKSAFDLVVPALTAPSLWLTKLDDVVDASREQRKRSRELRQECAIVRSTLREALAVSACALVDPIDLEALWRAEEADSTAKH
jgi:hypothetical protein